MPRYAEPNATKEMIEELWKKAVLDYIKKEEYSKEDIQDIEDGDCFGFCPKNMLPEKDFKVLFSFNNHISPWNNSDDDDLVNYYKVNGTTIALCQAGAYWEEPVYYAVYVEKGGKKLRVYIPTIGNVFDSYCMAAFGSAGEYGSKMPERFWPEDFFDDTVYKKYQEYIKAHKSLDDMLADIASHIEGTTSCVLFDKKPLKYNDEAKKWMKQQYPTWFEERQKLIDRGYNRRMTQFEEKQILWTAEEKDERFRRKFGEIVKITKDELLSFKKIDPMAQFNHLKNKNISYEGKVISHQDLMDIFAGI